MKHPVSYELSNPQVCVGAVCMSTSSCKVEVTLTTKLSPTFIL